MSDHSIPRFWEGRNPFLLYFLLASGIAVEIIVIVRGVCSADVNR